MPFRRIIPLFVSLIFSLSLTGPLLAVPITTGLHRLLDHGEGDLGGDYGLRADASGKRFSMELGGAEVILDWNGGPTAQILGKAYDNDTGELWDVDVELTGVISQNDGIVAIGSSGTVTDPLNNVIVLTGKQNEDGHAFLLLPDGHRLPGDDDSPVGRGWFLPDETVDDFLVRTERVPEPTTFALLAGASLLLFRRKLTA